MDVYSYDNVSGTVLVIPPYTIPIGGDVVSNGSEIAILEAYVGLGLEKYKNTVRQIKPAAMNTAGKLTADGKEIYAGALSQQEVAMVGRNTSSSGLRVAVIGASIESRGHPMWTFVDGKYARTSGIVTVQFDFALADKYFLPGQKIRVSFSNNTDMEGTFSILSCTVNPGVSTTVTYADARADISNSPISNVPGQIHDLASYSVSSGFQAFLNLACGGKLDLVTIATSSTNIIQDWGDARVQQIVDQGPFDAVIIGSGLIGNAIKGFSAGPTAVKAALLSVIDNINLKVKPRSIFIETYPLCRDVSATDGTFTCGNIINTWMWSTLASLRNNVTIVPGGEAMTQNYSVFNASPSTDVQNNWPEAAAMNPDGVHAAFGWARVRGFAMGEGINRFMSKWVSPEMGAMPLTKQLATGIDPDGNAFPNWLAGFWGNVDATKFTLPGTAGVSGSAPANCNMAFTAGRGSSTAVSSISTNPCGGTDWNVTIAGAGSSSGFTFRMEYAPTELLSALNSPLIYNKMCNLLLPVTVSVIENKIVYVNLELVATVGGQEYVLSGPQSTQGQYTQGALGRALDGGYSGIMRGPKFYVPQATYTAAVIRLTVKEINGNVPSGKTVIRLGPGSRFEAAQ